ncbi:MAG TPA: alpha-amylase family protein [Anaerolineaceae bacterium]|nr:alpha-amylase family protein [Anaerolineaceae bacterium]HPN53242.1 alpha-amylase family protein [Anaerolineaceae bacterium]
MMNEQNSPLSTATRRSFKRLMPRLETAFVAERAVDPQGWQAFARRLEKHFPALFELYYGLYSTRYDFFFHLEDLLASLARAWFARADDLRQLDAAREQNTTWFQSNQMLGGVIYVDLFAGDLEGVRSKIPYFKELGLTYLHLMPLFKMPEGENDGGYAVSSYREIHPPLGTMEQLATLARDLRAAGISLVVDLVFNHTSDESVWAEKAKAGDEEAREMYRIFPDRTMPDAYERSLREIFPDEHPGAFSSLPESQGGGWIWTTFHSYQWDLNYANPAVFNRNVEEMLFLANQGVEVMRLDAVAFIWKQMGTSCENLPEAHQLIRAFNAAARIAAPALLFKSEAIVHPDEVVKYIDPAECQLSYNPLLMALLWNSLATRKVKLLSHSMAARFKISPQAAWVNYVRCHDDIGWTFSDEDAAYLGVKGGDHRHFLNEFYRGRFEGSFARGLPFQENPKTGDCRISGTCASLAGLEKALSEEGPFEVELAVRRILLIHGIIMTIGGIPLLYLGDEIGTLNDYGYDADPAKARDSRWVHRPATDWARYERRHDPHTVEGRVFAGIRTLIGLRKGMDAFSGGEMHIFHTGSDHVLGFIRTHAGQRAIILANFSECEQVVPRQILEQNGCLPGRKVHGLGELNQAQDLCLAGLDLAIFAP